MGERENRNRQYYNKRRVNGGEGMNTKGNARAVETNRRIIQSFYRAYQEKGSVSQVTVGEICRRAGIHRSSFYLHYQDVYDLLEKVERSMEEKMTEACLRGLRAGQHVGDGFEALFGFIRDHREFYAIYLSEAAHPVLGVARRLYRDPLESLDYAACGYASQEELGYHEDFFLSGLTALVRRWLLTGCRESPGELAAILSREYSPNRSLFRWDAPPAPTP